MTNTDSGEELRNLARNLFAKDEPDERDAPDPATANLVPLEGSNPATHTTDMQELIRDLFAPNPDA